MAEPLNYGDRVDGPTGVGPAAALDPPKDKDGRLHPRNPWVGFYFALFFVAAGAAGLFVLITDFQHSIGMKGRAGGFVIVAPIVLLLVAVPTLVRAFRAVGPWMRHRATPLALRRAEKAADLDGQKRAPLIGFGSVALAAFLFLAVIFSLYRDNQVTTAGRVLQFEVLALLFLLTTACFGLLTQCLYYRRFYDGRDPRRDLPAP